MTALMYWTGLVVWALWLGGIAGVLTLWLIGKWMARRCARCGREVGAYRRTGWRRRVVCLDCDAMARGAVVGCGSQANGDLRLGHAPAPSPYALHIDAASDAEAVDILVGKETYA